MPFLPEKYKIIPFSIIDSLSYTNTICELPTRSKFWRAMIKLKWKDPAF